LSTAAITAPRKGNPGASNSGETPTRKTSFYWPDDKTARHGARWQDRRITRSGWGLRGGNVSGASLRDSSPALFSKGHVGFSSENMNPLPQIESSLARMRLVDIAATWLGVGSCRLAASWGLAVLLPFDADKAAFYFSSLCSRRIRDGRGFRWARKHILWSLRQAAVIALPIHRRGSSAYAVTKWRGSARLAVLADRVLCLTGQQGAASRGFRRWRRRWPHPLPSNRTRAPVRRALDCPKTAVDSWRQ